MTEPEENDAGFLRVGDNGELEVGLPSPEYMLAHLYDEPDDVPKLIKWESLFRNG